MPNYGPQVDAWGALVTGASQQAGEVEQRVKDNVKKKGLQGVSVWSEQVRFNDPLITAGGREAREHLIFQKDLGNSAKSTVAMRIADRGTEDLEISWRLFESNRASKIMWGMTGTTLIFFGFCIAVAGLLTAGIASICGLWLIGVGAGWWGAGKNRTTLSTHNVVDSKLFALAVDDALMTALDDVHVEPFQLKVVQKSNIEGIGQLGATHP